MAVACAAGWVGLQQLAWVWEGVQVGGKGWEEEVPGIHSGRKGTEGREGRVTCSRVTFLRFLLRFLGSTESTVMNLSRVL